jgi:fructokinase
MQSTLRIGIDLGGTKIAGIVLFPDGRFSEEMRVPTPRGDYDATLDTVSRLVEALEMKAGAAAQIGVGIPGSISPSTGRVQNANSTWINGRHLDVDLPRRLNRAVRFANDANCFALSEALDGAASGRHCVFGVIVGTGCGGGLVIGGRLLEGPRGIGGEWGHNPLPWALPNELPGPRCWCGRNGCIETWVSGPGLALDHERMTGRNLTPEDIVAAAEAGDAGARATLDRHASRLARGLGHVVNMIDPDVIVLGGGLSQLPHLYAVLPDLLLPHVFADDGRVEILPPRWGDASGVRGAARLWP